MEYTIYKVLPGNTLWGIANFFGTEVEDIIELNNLKEPELIYPDMELKIPVRSPKAPRYYAVRPEDTLFTIASRYAIDVNHLAKINNLANPNIIYPGQILMLRR